MSKDQKIIDYAKKLYSQYDKNRKKKHSFSNISRLVLIKFNEKVSTSAIKSWSRKNEWNKNIEKPKQRKKTTARVAIRLQEDKVFAAIKGSGGIMSKIARALDADWWTADKHIKENEVYHAALKLEMEIILDGCELNLFDEAVNKKESWAIRFLLATKGKHRGYIQGTDITSKGDKVGQSTVIILPSNGRDQED